MSTQIEKFKLQEKIRRLFFRHRGDVLAVARDAGLEEQIDFVRQTCSKIKRSFGKDVNFEIACFVTDALLAGREQRLIMMEDRVNELLSKAERISICHEVGVTEHKFDGEIHYKCNSCHADCTTRLEDKTNDTDVVRYVDRMRKEDELIYKMMITMGFISKMDSPKDAQGKLPEAIPVDSVALSPEEVKLQNKLNELPPDEISELRNLLEKKIVEMNPNAE